MTLLALLLPVDDDPRVVADDSWGEPAISAQLGDGPRQGCELTWSPNPDYSLHLQAATGRPAPVNPAGVALAGRDGLWLCGPVLLMAVGADGQAVSLSTDEVLAIGVRLLLGEQTNRAARRKSATSPATVTAAGPGASPPTQGGTPPTVSGPADIRCTQPKEEEGS